MKYPVQDQVMVLNGKKEAMYMKNLPEVDRLLSTLNAWPADKIDLEARLQGVMRVFMQEKKFPFLSETPMGMMKWSLDLGDSYDGEPPSPSSRGVKYGSQKWVWCTCNLEYIRPPEKAFMIWKEYMKAARDLCTELLPEGDGEEFFKSLKLEEMFQRRESAPGYSRHCYRDDYLIKSVVEEMLRRFTND